MSDNDPIDLVDDLFDEACHNCGRRLHSPDETICPQCGHAVSAKAHGAKAGAAGAAGSTVDKPAASDPTPAESAGMPTGTAEAKPAATGTSEPELELEPEAPADPKVVRDTKETLEAKPTPKADAPPAATPDGATATTTGHPGGMRLALALAVTCAIVLCAMYLAGWSGLFPRQDGLFRDTAGNFTLESVRWSDRAVDLVRTLIQRTVIWAAALAALWALSLLRRAPVPDWPAAAARMAAITLATALVTMIELSNRPIEMTLEILLQAAMFVGLVVVWFRLAFVEAAQLLGMAALGFILVHLAALLVVWATGATVL